MKKLLKWMCLGIFPLITRGQDIPVEQVPVAVQQAVAAKFSNTGKIEWEKKKTWYEAEFRIDNIGHNVQIEPAGRLLWIKKDLAVDKLPASVSEAIRRDYPGHIIDEVEQLEKDGVTYYQAELEKGNAKDIHVVYSADGRIAKDILYID